MASMLRIFFRHPPHPIGSLTRKMSSAAGALAEARFLMTPGEVSRLLEQHSGGNNKIIPLDASWHMPNSPRNARKEFDDFRIPEARFIDLDEVASPHELGLKHMMPSPEQFAKVCDKLGITRDTHVILYDSHGIFSSPRALFMFRAFGHTRSSVLDGGLPAWQARDPPSSPDVPENSTKDLELKYPTPTYDTAVVNSYEQIVSNAELDPSNDSAAALVVDARSSGRFTGKDPEPRPGLSSGRIPHSFSLPFNTFLETHTAENGKTYTTFLPVPALRQALVNAIGEENAKDVLQGKRSIVTSCGSGMTAGVLWLGLKLLGVENPALYDESWTGYAMRKESKIVKDV